MAQPTLQQLERIYGRSPDGPVRNCMTCAHRHASSAGVTFDRCVLTGHYCDFQRKFPSRVCDISLSGWTPIPPSGWTRFIRWLCPWLRN
jgi:hypothetical protein